MTRSREVDQILVTGLEDWVMLQEVLWIVTRDARDDDAKARVAETLAQLFDEGLMVPGELLDPGFVDWPDRPSWLTQARQQIEGLEWHPMNQGFWLRLTPRGAEVAKDLDPDIVDDDGW